MSLEFLQISWFFLIGILFTGYALLDGFDLGVGNLFLLAKNPKDKMAMLESIGPFWDSNQVWLITGGGALFAAFPEVYATTFSGFYLAFMLLLFALILRAVSIEFYWQIKTPTWQKVWSTNFFIGSIIPSFLYGVAMGNILQGIPLDANFNYLGGFFNLLNPYALIMGVFTVCMFTIHGAAYLFLQAPKVLHKKMLDLVKISGSLYTLLFIILTVWSYVKYPRLFNNFQANPLLFFIPVLVLALMIYVPYVLTKKPQQSFVITSLSILGSLLIVGLSLFPYLVPASNNLLNSITLYNGSSSQLTLLVMLILAIIGMPLVLFYTSYVYRKLLKKDERIKKQSANLSI